MEAGNDYMIFSVDLLRVANAAVDIARGIMLRTEPGRITSKGDRDMASEVDYAIEKSVREHLSIHTPDISFLGEEEGGGAPAAGTLTWVLDPIDGTANFIRGLPMCAISLGLIDGKEGVLGIVDLPFLGARYSALKGEGAYCGNRQIHVSNTSDIAEAIVTTGDYAVGVGALPRNQARLSLTKQLAGRVQRIRMLGTAALDLVWLADGKTDASFALSNKAWDMTAGVVIAREAGARVVDSSGIDHNFDSTATIAANAQLLPQLLPVIQEVLAQTGQQTGPDTDQR
jgi:myo-inositol-1(or 4)-monophosphatase